MNIGLFGLPGAGKGTQAGKMAKFLRVPHISTGDMFREIQKGNSKLAGQIREILAAGKLVSDDLVTELAFERLKQPDCQMGFILDGYPRTLIQAETLQKSPYALDVLISLDVERQEIIRRLSERRVCSQCGSVWNLSFLPQDNKAICPDDGSLLVQRADDSVESITTRLEIFEHNFSPVMEFFTANKLLCHVNGMGDADSVFTRLMDVIDRVSKVGS